jgi:protoporphyrinogen oxidase
LRWCVVGGGILGLVTALRLCQAGHAVTVLEASPSLGGLASAWWIGEVTWDRHYHVILPTDRHLLALLDELGLGDQVRWVTSRTGFFTGDRLLPLDSALDYLRFPLLGPLAKLRLAATIALASRIRDDRRLEGVAIEDWLVRWSGREAFERIWRPLLRAKLGDNHRHASAAFICAIMRRLYLARRSGLKTERLGFVEGGYARILDRLEARLRASGVAIRTNCPVERLAGGMDGVELRTRQGLLTTDQAVVTVATPLVARMLPDLNAAERSRLDEVLYQGILCASLLIERPLSGNYLTYIADPAIPFTAVVEMSALTGTAVFGGRTLVYLPRYATGDDPYWQLDDRSIEERLFEGLRRIVPDLQPGEVRAFRLSRVRHVFAVPTLDHASRRPPLATSIPRVSLVTSAQIVNGTLNVNETLALAADALPRLLARTTAASPPGLAA